MDKHCKNCIYYGKIYDYLWCCEYIFKVGKMRPCEPGKDCIVKQTKRKRRSKEDEQK